MSPANTDAQRKAVAKRKADERQRYRDAGLRRVDLWAHPEDHAAIKAHAERLAKRRGVVAKRG